MAGIEPNYLSLIRRAHLPHAATRRKSPREDLNLQLPAYEAGTLPVELHGRHGRMGSERFELSTHGLRVRYVTSYATSPENMERIQET